MQQTNGKFKDRSPWQVVVGLFVISCLLWTVFFALYLTFESGSLISSLPFYSPDDGRLGELENIRLTYATNTSNLATSTAATIVTPQTPIQVIPTTVVIPTYLPPLQPPNQIIGPTVNTSSPVGPTTSSLKSNQPSPTGLPKGLLSLPTIVKTTPTPTPTYPRLKLTVKLPDTDQNVRTEKIAFMIYRENNFGKLISLSETKMSVVMERVDETDYFESEEIIVKIKPTVSLKKPSVKEKPAKYAVFVKGQATVGRLFKGVVFQTDKKSLPLDCSLKTTSIKDCGDLVSRRDEKVLFSGDSDGFLDGSPSYNRVDVRDLESFASRQKNADFNLDGQINRLDLEILKRNYGERGDVVE